MRLVDADALLERVDEERKYLLARGQTGAEHILVHNFRNLIDNAPSVFNCNTCKNMGNERECVDCHDYSNYVHYEERPQGEWIRYRDNPHQPEHIKCSNCGQYWSIADHDKIFDFCFKCGAKMEVKKND